MYSGASADGECPLVLDTSTPSCGNSRFGCWVCTMVEEDKSMAAMIQNDEEKAWMLPLLEFRNEIADRSADWGRRDFRRKDGRLTYNTNAKRLVHGPYNQEVRVHFLRRLLQVEKLIHEIGPTEIREIPLITVEELQAIRKIWLDEKHEFEDKLPRIYEEETGRPYHDDLIRHNRYFGSQEALLLDEVCSALHGEEELLPGLQRTLLDMEAKAAASISKKNLIKNFEAEIKKAFYRDEEDALHVAEQRKRAFIPEDEDEPLE